MKARTQAANQLQGLRVTAPEELRHRLRGLSTKELVSVAAHFRLGHDPRNVPTATKFALRSVARRYEALSAEIAELETRTSTGWWPKPPRSWSLWQASEPTPPRRS
jgi:transposase